MGPWRPAPVAWCRSNFFEQVSRKCFPECLRPIVGPLFGLNSWNGTSAPDHEPQHEGQLSELGGEGDVGDPIFVLRQQ